MNPSYGVGATGRWGTVSDCYIAEGKQLETDYDNAIYKTQAEVDEFQLRHNIKTRVFYRSDKENLRNLYERDPDTGILKNKRTGKVALGAAIAEYKGFNKVTCTIHMSPHKTYEGFVITLNHELIHVHHRTNYYDVWLREGETVFNQLTEYCAYKWYTQLFYYSDVIPSEYIPSAAVLSRNLMHLSLPDNLIPIVSGRYGRVVW